ncbi:MAG: NUDIX hydrolase [candidate division TM6 bacterium GW2011_GWE2_42_60]|nr:MAG: NUDIX hydrolase [candidate division TM6 bacterium GW2011_GWE2_42_60]HBY05784.1 hypothetical protein [Candidatus Dependentiae bacterium]
MHILPDKNCRIGVYGVLIKDNSILMVKTQSGDRLVYNFPGGGIEPNESLEDSLVRECQEEIGALVTVEKLIFFSQKLYTHSSFPDICSFYIYYEISCNGPIDPAKQCAKWFDLNALPLDQMLDADLEFVHNRWFIKAI